MNKTIIAFDVDYCRFELNCSHLLTRIPINKAKKLFNLMCCQHWRNIEAIKKTDEVLANHIKDARTKLSDAVKSYTDGYKDTKYDCSLTEIEIKRIECENKRLFNDLSRKKKALERIKKVQAIFSEVKTKYKIND